MNDPNEYSPYQAKTLKLKLGIENAVSDISRFMIILSDIRTVYLTTDTSEIEHHELIEEVYRILDKFNTKIKNELDLFHERWINNIEEPNVIEVFNQILMNYYLDLSRHDINNKQYTGDNINTTKRLFNVMYNLITGIVKDAIYQLAILIEDYSH